MAVNKVVYNSSSGTQTLIDLTGDTVTPENLAKGVKAHDAKGEQITGAMVVPDGVPKGLKIKYIIPATLTAPNASSGTYGIGKTPFTFKRENINQLFFVDWMLQDATDFTTAGYWCQHVIWQMLYQGNYSGQHLYRIDAFGSGKAGNNNKLNQGNMAKADLTKSFSGYEFGSTDANYAWNGRNYKGLIIITDSSYDGLPMVDETKLSQFFTCDYITAGW